jgi:prepilin signal peptidase PulO-like enzyme (type II secretory pathway)
MLAVIDMEYRVVLYQTAIAGAILAIPLGIYTHGFLQTIIGLLAGFILMYIIYLLGIGFAKILAYIKKSQGTVDEAVGFGDVYLCGIIGILLGWPGIIAGIILGVLIFAIVGTLYMLILILIKKYKFSTALPMAPFLIAAMLILLFRPG